MFVVGRLVKDVFDMFTKAILVTQRTQWLVVGLELWGRSQNPKLPRCCSSFDSEWDIFRLLKPQCASHDIIFWGIFTRLLTHASVKWSLCCICFCDSFRERTVGCLLSSWVCRLNQDPCQFLVFWMCFCQHFRPAMLQVFYGMSSDTAMKAHRDVSLSRVKSNSLRMSNDQFPTL